MTITIEELLRNLNESGLLTDGEISTIHESIGSRKRIRSAETFARELVRRKHLTKLQAAAVLKGKTRNLVFGEYIVMEKIGSGGMGQVFKARHKPTDKLVALKVLSADAVKNRRLIERFKKEAKAVARLKHPNIVRAFEAGKINRIRYLVMEYVDGENMLARVKRKGPLSVDECVSCILQASRGLDYAHQKGIVHRDIKPSNLLRDRRTGRVKLLDMGLARVDEPDDDIRLTMPGQMLGTARFMSPEQVEDARKADIRSDIYSLGCTLHFILRAKAPYSGETVAHTLMAHVSAPIPDLCEKRPDAPQWLGRVFTRMLAKKPRDRYQTMGELVQAIQQHLGEDLTDHDGYVFADAEPDDEYSQIIAGRNDEGSSLVALFSDVAAESASELPAERFRAPEAPDPPDLADLAADPVQPRGPLLDQEDRMAVQEMQGKSGSPDSPIGADADEMDLADGDADDDVTEKPGDTGTSTGQAQMPSAQAFDLDSEPAAADERFDTAPGSAHPEGQPEPSADRSSTASIGDGADTRAYAQQKLTGRRQHEHGSARRFRKIGLLAGRVIVLGVLGYIFFGRG